MSFSLQLNFLEYCWKMEYAWTKYAENTLKVWRQRRNCGLHVVDCLWNMPRQHVPGVFWGQRQPFLTTLILWEEFCSSLHSVILFLASCNISDKAMEISPVLFQDMDGNRALAIVAHLLAIHLPYAISIKSDVANENISIQAVRRSVQQKRHQAQRKCKPQWRRELMVWVWERKRERVQLPDSVTYIRALSGSRGNRHRLQEWTARGVNLKS